MFLLSLRFFALLSCCILTCLPQSFAKMSGLSVFPGDVAADFERKFDTEKASIENASGENSQSTQKNISDAPISSFEGNMNITTDYVFRGISQSNEKPVLQAGLTYNHKSGAYVGFWGSSVDYADGDDSLTEMDAFIGYAGSIQKLSYDFGFIHYMYPGADRRLNYDFSEFVVAFSYDFDYFSLGTSINYSPEYFGNSGEAFYTAGSINIPLSFGISIDAGIGHQTLQVPTAYGIGNDYTDWHIGLNIPVDKFTLVAQYMDTDLSDEECSDGCEPRFVGSVSYDF